MRIFLLAAVFALIFPAITAHATPITFVSASATYYTSTENVDFVFNFSRPLISSDYFSFGGTIIAPDPQYRSEFFVLSLDSDTIYVDYAPSIPYLAEFYTVEMPPASPIFVGSMLSISIPLADLGISAPIFQLAGDVASSAGQFDSFGADFPAFSTVDTQQVHLPEPPTSLLAMFTASIFAASVVFQKIFHADPLTSR